MAELRLGETAIKPRDGALPFVLVGHFSYTRCALRNTSTARHRAHRGQHGAGGGAFTVSDELSSVHQAINQPRVKVFLSGPAGSGKTTLCVARLRWLIQSGMPTTALLVLLPQRLLALPYLELLRDPSLGPAGRVDVITFDGLARRIIDLFWPLIGERAGFAHPERPPVFLTVETAQYFMDGIVSVLMDQQAFFEGVVIDRSRLLGQLLDNLNKAALIGIPLAEVPARLKAAWAGESARRAMFDQAGECIERFRRYCLAHNLLDFSLQIETFVRHLYPQPAVRAYLFDRYRHLIVDNLEEDTPVVHDVLLEWVERCESAWLAFDRDGGHRIFLGADPASATRLAAACQHQVELSTSLVAPPDVLNLGYQIGLSLRRQPATPLDPAVVAGDFRRCLQRPGEGTHRFHPQMLDWVAGECARLVHEQRVPPEQIVILAPFVSDALRFALAGKLAARQVPAQTHRPWRALRDEMATRCLLTLAKLAYPSWGMAPPAFDVMLALVQAVRGLDLVRARLLSDIVYRRSAAGWWLGTFADIQGETRQRIGDEMGERYDTLRAWLEGFQTANQDVPLDHFLARLFGEVLSQPGFGFHPEPATHDIHRSSAGDSARQMLSEAGRVASQLIESARQFRHSLELVPDVEADQPLGARFVCMVERGVMAATFVPGWQLTRSGAVLIAPAYTYLMTNRPVDYQFWLDVGSLGWWERIYQPLTHPYVLRRDWDAARAWSDEDEYNARRELLCRLVMGLVRRCRKGVFLAASDLNEQGYEQHGPLLQAIQSALRRVSAEGHEWH